MPSSLRLFAPCFLISLFIMTGCGGSMISSLQPQPSPTPQNTPVPEALYVQNDLDPQLFGFRINEADGTLTPIPGSPFPMPGNIRKLGATVDGKFLLARRFGGVPPEPVGTYAVPVHSDGSLPRFPDQPTLPNVLSMVSMRPDLINTVEAGEITQRPFDPATGSFSMPTAATPCSPHVFDFECSWLFGPSPDGSTLWMLGGECVRVDCSASLTAVPLKNGSVQFPSVNRSVAAGTFSNPVVLNSGAIAIGSDGFDTDSIAVTMYSPDGQVISKCGALDSSGCSQASSIASDPAGKFLFIGTLDGKLSSVSLTSAGFSAQQVKVSLSTDLRPDNMIVNNSGRFLYILDQLSNTVTGYSIGADGTLSPIAGAKFDVSGPNAASSGGADQSMVIVKLPTE